VTACNAVDSYHISEEHPASIFRVGHNPEDHNLNFHLRENFISFSSATELVCLNSSAIQQFYIERREERKKRKKEGNYREEERRIERRS
jgi:hypothetical protein